MKRGTAEERRWENGLRQGGRGSGLNESMASPVVQRSARMRPPIETRKTNVKANTSPPLAATAALQAYLSRDVDAESASRRTGGPIAPPLETRRLSSASSVQEELQGRTKSAEARLPIDGNAVSTAKGTLRAESPLSRFQKHMKRTRSAGGAGGKSIRPLSTEVSRSPRSSFYHKNQPAGSSAARASATDPSSETLARSLMDKIQEAKRLRQEAVGRFSANGMQKDNRFQECGGADRLQGEPQQNLRVWPTPSPVLERPSAARSCAPVPASTSSPPVPHAKPVMPAIPQLPPAGNLGTVDSTTGSKEKEIDAKPAIQRTNEKTSSIDEAIVTTNAALVIQRTWRKRREERARVTLVIDKSREDVTPLFSNRKTEQLGNDALTLADECAGTTCKSHDGKPFTRDASSDPWTDHELVFLEEGRCVGDLRESVRKGVFMDRDELVWKRPQHVIQQLETQRVSTIKKKRFLGRKLKHPETLTTDAKPPKGMNSSVNDANEMVEHLQRSSKGNTFPFQSKVARQKRKLRRFHLCKLRNSCKKIRFGGARGSTSSKARRLFVCVRRGGQVHGENGIVGESGQGEALVDPLLMSQETYQNAAAKEVRNSLSAPYRVEEPSIEPTQDDGNSAIHDHFVVFTDSGGEVDFKHSRNDLLTVGDLALARSLLRDERHCRAANDVAAHHSDFIPLILPPPSQTSAFEQLEVLVDEAATSKELVAISCPSGDASASFSEPDIQQTLPVDDEPEVLAHHHSILPCEELPPELERRYACNENSLRSSYSPLPFRYSKSSGACTKSESCSASCEPNQESSSRSTDPIRVLVGMKSAVTETMTWINSEYRDDTAHDKELAVSNQESEECSPHLALVATVASIPAIRARLDEDKRIEFLRVLDDFKRCLQPPSSCSSSTCSLTTTELKSPCQAQQSSGYL